MGFVAVSVLPLLIGLHGHDGPGHKHAVRPAAKKKAVVQQFATGLVYEDRNWNGKKDADERSLANVRVSSHTDITKTDRNGRWRLPLYDNTIYFVIKPRGYMTALDQGMQLPRFYYIHNPKGSPAYLKYPAVKPTGPLPASIDFPLYTRREPNKFTALFFGDTQPRDLREVDYISKSIVEPLIGKTDAAFGVPLGDIAFDNLETTEPLVKSIALIGIPWYNVLGNHDVDYQGKTDKEANGHFERVFGPAYYSFDHGPTHFVVLDNVVWQHGDTQPDKRGRYKAGLGKEQLDWLRKDLALVPQNQMVVLMMHIPLNENEDKQDIFRMIEKRPYVISVAAHTHFQEHRFFTEKDGWKGAKPHHHIVNVTTCGSWWSGAPDPRGIPHTTMRDGAPNGYSIFTFDGTQYKIEYRAAGRPATYQMNIISPDFINASELAGTSVFVNVFGGSEQSKVEVQFGADGPWQTMAKADEADPMYLELIAREKGQKPPYRDLPGAVKSPHLWKMPMPRYLAPGVYPIHVRTTDMFGQVYLSTRSLRVD